eukprot:9609103-Ditylum_brightwellii.AAC.1
MESNVELLAQGTSGVEQRHMAICGYGGGLLTHDLHCFGDDGGNNGKQIVIFLVQTTHSSFINAIGGIGGGSIGHGSPTMVMGRRDGCI